VNRGEFMLFLIERTIKGFLGLALMAALFFVASASLALAASGGEKVNVTVKQMDGFGRVILTFVNRLDLPDYKMRNENGVLSFEFSTPMHVTLPDISGELPDFIAVSRIDPDQQGIRFGLKIEVKINVIKAGERLYIDFMPANWQGLPPGLPAEVVAELASRAQDAQKIAELRRRIELARLNNPQASLSVGRHPTFIRLLFDWSQDTSARYFQDGDTATIEFSWPVNIDLFPLLENLPQEIVSAQSSMKEGSNLVELKLAKGVVPRFYQNSNRQFVLDVDLINPDANALTPEKLLAMADEERSAKVAAAQARTQINSKEIAGSNIPPATDQVELTPKVTQVGSTVRINFPFEQETPAAVFRRGDQLWIILDSPVIINAPDDPELLNSISSEFSVVSAGNTQVVRIKLNSRRLASLGSQGSGWVLSLGDMMLSPTEPIKLERRKDDNGKFEIVANLARPARLHQLRDPQVGDVLEVVTAFPPAQGIIRSVGFVDFKALRSVHGLVIKPMREELKVTLGANEAVLSTKDGLIVSPLTQSRTENVQDLPSLRSGYIDLTGSENMDPVSFSARREALMDKAANSEGRERENARLELAYLLLGNRLGNEALGVLNVMASDNRVDDMAGDISMATAAAAVVAFRSKDALALLNSAKLSEDVDAVMWRSIARTRMLDFKGARSDVLATETIIKDYPVWVRNLFLLSGLRAAVETGDMELAVRLTDKIEFARLDGDQASEFVLLEARIDEMDGRYDEALDNYGRVIAQDIRPTRAGAIYRTVALLDKMGRLDAAKGAQTLSRESIVWRGGPLEAQMLKLLAQLQFRNKDYRNAFSTVREAAQTHIETKDIVALTEEAQQVFVDLFNNGAADALSNLDALSLFYDFRYLTPSGAKGDEMIRNLARRLVRVDLLQQAGDLLQYQVDTRLEGAARAQIAADLAIIRIADGKPAKALSALKRTSLANLAPSLTRQRRILEGRALIDAGRMQLALDVLKQLDGRDADLLRIDAYWRLGEYSNASEQIERVYSQRSSDIPLSQPARMNLIKAAVGYVLGNDRIGLSRVRAKFADQISNSPEWPMFDYVTSSLKQSSSNFKTVAAEVAAIDSMSAFLNAYRQTYEPDGALAPSTKPG